MSLNTQCLLCVAAGFEQRLGVDTGSWLHANAVIDDRIKGLTARTAMSLLLCLRHRQTRLPTEEKA